MAAHLPCGREPQVPEGTAETGLKPLTSSPKPRFAGQHMHSRPRGCQGPTHHDPVVDEATAVAGWLQVRVLLRAGHTDAPHLLPGLVQLHVDRVHARVVGRHCVPHVRGNAMLLGRGGPGRVSVGLLPHWALFPFVEQEREIRG